MRKVMVFVICITLALLFNPKLSAQDYEVFFVTSLNDSGSGTLRECISESNRLCLFKVGGIIHLEDELTISKNNIRVSGQTAKGNIILDGGGRHALEVKSAKNVIVEYLTLRNTFDGIQSTYGSQNVLFDHISSSWSKDENASTYKSGGSTTFRYLLSGEGLRNHSKGILLYDSANVIYSYFVSNDERNIRCQGGKVNFLYSVVHNGKRGTWCDDKHGDVYLNMIGIEFSVGPNTDTKKAEIKLDENVTAYLKDISGYDVLEIDNDGNDIVNSPFDHMLNVPALSSQELMAVVGNSRILDCDGEWILTRDSTDIRFVSEYYTKQGEIAHKGKGSIYPGDKRSNCQDLNGNGIPDEYESAQPNNTIIDYLNGNEVVSNPLPTPRATPTIVLTVTPLPTGTPKDDSVKNTLDSILYMILELYDELEITKP